MSGGIHLLTVPTRLQMPSYGRSPKCLLCAGGRVRGKERGDKRPEAPETHLKHHHLLPRLLQQ